MARKKRGETTTNMDESNNSLGRARVRHQRNKIRDCSAGFTFDNDNDICELLSKGGHAMIITVYSRCRGSE